MTEDERKETEAQWALWEREERESLLEEDPLNGSYAYVSFESRSNGRGRKRRRCPRGVELIVNRDEGKAVALKDVPTGRADVWAQEALDGSVPQGEDPWPVFVARLKALAALGSR